MAPSRGNYCSRDRAGSRVSRNTIIEEEDNLRKVQPQPDPKSAVRNQLIKAFDQNDEDAILHVFETAPTLTETYPWRLHAAACKGFERLAAWLLDHGSDVNSLRGDRAPLDMAAECAPNFPLDNARKMMIWLRDHGAELTPRGRSAWRNRVARRQTAEGRLANPPAMKAGCAYGGLLEIAAANDHLDRAELLLDFGFDPNERAPIEGAGRDGS